MKFVLDHHWLPQGESLPARGVWIEIGEVTPTPIDTMVTPRKGSVD